MPFIIDISELSNREKDRLWVALCSKYNNSGASFGFNGQDTAFVVTDGFVYGQWGSPSTYGTQATELWESNRIDGTLLNL